MIPFGEKRVRRGKLKRETREDKDRIVLKFDDVTKDGGQTTLVGIETPTT